MKKSNDDGVEAVLVPFVEPIGVPPSGGSWVWDSVNVKYVPFGEPHAVQLTVKGE